VYGQNKARLDYLSSHGISDPEHGGSPCSGDCCLHGSLTSFCAFGWVLQVRDIVFGLHTQTNSFSDIDTQEYPLSL
jgi:hypothetical protein